MFGTPRKFIDMLLKATVYRFLTFLICEFLIYFSLITLINQFYKCKGEYRFENKFSALETQFEHI